MSIGPATSSAVRHTILQPSGPCVPQSCNLRASCPPILLPPGPYAPVLLLRGSPTTYRPLDTPCSSPLGLYAPPMPPLFPIVGCLSPHPSSIARRHSPTHPVSLGIIPTPIQCCGATAPAHSVIWGPGLRGPLLRSALWGGVHSLRHPYACPKISAGRGFVGPFSPTHRRSDLSSQRSNCRWISFSG